MGRPLDWRLQEAAASYPRLDRSRPARHGGISIAERSRRMSCPTCRLSSKLLLRLDAVKLLETRNPPPGTPPTHLNNDAPILDRAWQSTDRSNRDRTPRRNLPRLVFIADKPDNLPVPRVAGIDDFWHPSLSFSNELASSIKSVGRPASTVLNTAATVIFGGV